MTESTDQGGNINVEETKLDDQFNSILNTLGTFRIQITALSAQIRTLEKTVKRQIKQNKAAVSKKNKQKRKPSGFAKPTKISDALCDFMLRDYGTEVARTDVTKHIIQYIKDHNLQKPENKKIIQPDEKLKNLLEPEEGAEVTYFNLQRYMNKHFLGKVTVISNETTNEPTNETTTTTS